MLRTQGTQWVKADGSAIELKGVNLGNWMMPEFWMMGYGDNAAVNDQCTLQAVLDRRFGFAQRERLLKLFRDHWMTQRDWDLIPQFRLNLVRLPFIWSVIEDEKIRATCAPMPGITWIRPSSRPKGAACMWCWTCTAPSVPRAPSTTAAAPARTCTGARRSTSNAPPGWGSTAEQLAAVVKALYTAVRALDPKHIIILPDHPKGITAYGKTSARGMHDVVFETHPYPGFFGWGKPRLEVHRDWLQCSPDGGGLCQWQARMAALNTPLYIGEFQPWAELEPELSGQITRASFDAYAKLGWASTAWSFKKLSRSGGLAPLNWGLVTNAQGAGVPELDFEKASLTEIENFFKLFASVPYQINAPVHKWMNSATAPEPFKRP
ncbi:MAG: glycoside hydrolase [Rhodoferax sp.]|nr:glycoside hydrolase [Rhodoferax sp.]